MQHDACRGSFLLAVTELSKIYSFSTYSLPLFPHPPPDFSSGLYQSSGWLWSAKHHITGSVCPCVNASFLANLFTLTLCLRIYLSFSRLDSSTLSVRGAQKKASSAPHHVSYSCPPSNKVQLCPQGTALIKSIICQDTSMISMLPEKLDCFPIFPSSSRDRVSEMPSSNSI